jgi:hypothetical protein
MRGHIDPSNGNDFCPAAPLILQARGQAPGATDARCGSLAFYGMVASLGLRMVESASICESL